SGRGAAPWGNPSDAASTGQRCESLVEGGAVQPALVHDGPTRIEEDVHALLGDAELPPDRAGLVVDVLDGADVQVGDELLHRLEVAQARDPDHRNLAVVPGARVRHGRGLPGARAAPGCPEPQD